MKQMKKNFAKKLLAGVLCSLSLVGMHTTYAATSEIPSINKTLLNVQGEKIVDNTLVTQGVKEQSLHLEEKWDKTFPENPNVQHHKVTFHNRYGITLVGDLYEPKDSKGNLPGIAVAGPFGAVKEQAAGLYAQEMASRGYAALAFDPSFIGESGGNVRNVASPDINTEDFSAAVDFLSNDKDVDANRIGLIGICGFGGMALNDAAMDTRVKATITSTMYDMSRMYSNGYFDKNDSEASRHERLAAMNAQRTKDYTQGYFDRVGATNPKPEDLPKDAPQFRKDYSDYYATSRGYHPRSVNSRGGWNKTSSLSFINMPILSREGEIESAVLMIHGEKAHSRYFSETAFKGLKGDNKELYIVPGATHTDLYDGGKNHYIPFDKIDQFFQEYLK